MLGHRYGFLQRSMGMDDAAETITQVLSVIDRTPTSYESVCLAPENALKNALNHTGVLAKNQKPDSSTT
ncbi:MAG: hypothetical protein OEW20_04765 [Nitrospira sp.]|nr:hypothetical protein [Nitrospira sp.]